MKNTKLQQIAALAFSLLLSATAWAAPTSGTPYNTDPQNEYVQDSTTDAINNVNMILCIMNGMNMSGSGMINGGAYVALVDMNKCKAQGGSSDTSSSSSGASASANYMTAIVDVTRASTADPMIANVWMSMTEQGRPPEDIYVKVRATSSPTDVPPYGVFRLDFMGKDHASGASQMNGYIDSASGLLQYFENGVNSSNVALALSAAQTTSGHGTMRVQDRNTLAYTTYNFNYDTNNFRRDDGTNDRCFDRLKANAGRSVWRYGTYKDSDGTRVDQANPSFPTTATYGGNSYYGYAGYWGVGFQGLDLNTIPDANPVSGLVVHDQRPAHTSDTFSLSKVSGKLTKWTRNAKTLADMDGIPFYFGADLTGKTTGGSPAVTSWGNWQMHWDNTNARFVVTGSQVCNPGAPCALTSLTTPATVNLGALNGIPIAGWSDSFGGSFNIPSSATDHVGTDAVYYFSQSLVIPGSVGAPTALYCLNNCPDATSVNAANAFTNGTAPSPFGGTTGSQWFYAPATANTVTYAYGSGGLTNASIPMIITNAAFYAASTNFQYGVQTGRLFTSALLTTDCPAWVTTGNASAVCEPPNPAEYYTWSTSRDQWNQSMWLTHTNGASSGTVVTFDPPQNIQYTVPSGAAYGTWAGKNIQLQFNGFGNLGGIPGYCVNPVDNTVANCNQNTRYVPAFSIPDGATMTLGATTLVVKALDAEIRLKDMGVGATVCPTLSVTQTLTLPTATGNHDVSAAPGTYSIGTTRPTVSNSTPKVIDGVVQY